MVLSEESKRMVSYTSDSCGNSLILVCTFNKINAILNLQYF